MKKNDSLSVAAVHGRPSFDIIKRDSSVVVAVFVVLLEPMRGFMG